MWLAGSYASVPAGVTLPTSAWPSKIPSASPLRCAVAVRVEKRSTKATGKSATRSLEIQSNAGNLLIELATWRNLEISRFVQPAQSILGASRFQQSAPVTASSGRLVLRCLRCRRGLPVNDMIDSRLSAHIAQPVQLVRGAEDDRPWAHPRPLAVLECLHRALPYDHQFLIWMPMRRMGRFAGIERGHVNLELIECSRARLAERAHRASLRRPRRNCIPIEDSRTHYLSLVCKSERPGRNSAGDRRSTDIASIDPGDLQPRSRGLAGTSARR